MGLIINDIKVIGPDEVPLDAVGNRPRINFCWIVGRREERPGTYPAWHIQGVSLDENEAVSMCRNEDYWIGPLPLGVSISHDVIDWPCAYFPLRENKQKGIDQPAGN